ncbi:hypothetical protein XHV734_2821 [Xanthomonas hortorum pv. vitians]|nr:hypothetical protein XHV734_2821 [Xanthomonas hortorum pv. vitians]
MKACLLLGLLWEANRTLRQPNNARHPLFETLHTDHLNWSLPAHRRGTLRGMDAA